MKKITSGVTFLFSQLLAAAQFAPPAGQAGSTAIHKDSAAFVVWATGCSVVRGYQDISNPTLGYASVGDSSMALGAAGANGVVSLGDGGYATVTFAHPITDGQGWDFAVFENSFSDDYLELAFVEVSSDGVNYFRFPATSYTQDTAQIDGFGSIDATKIDNLAGKYRALYGTPFDLQQLSGLTGLDINAVTHVKIIDVVGCIQNAYTTFDQYGNKINDPWSTPFASGGFDLDAVGVIHSTVTSAGKLAVKDEFNIYPNPASDFVFLQMRNGKPKTEISIMDYSGKEIKSFSFSGNSPAGTVRLNTSDIETGLYFISVLTVTGNTIKKIIIRHD